MCKQEKELDEFHRDKRTTTGRAWYCKDCANRKSREWHNSHKNLKEFKLIRRDRNFRTKYGMSLNEYNQKLLDQESKCEICSIDLIDNYNIHVDHCHKTNEIRGLLCGNCNRGLGSFHDSPQKMLQAIKYVGKYDHSFD